MPRRGEWRSSTRSVPASDLLERALGIGDPNSQKKSSGRHRARYSPVDLTGGGSVVGSVKEFDVPHDLGEVPTSVVLDSCENAATPGTALSANGVRKINWSHSHVHVEVTLLAGSFDGCRANFRVVGR